jgi:hypothetical protein
MRPSASLLITALLLGTFTSTMRAQGTDDERWQITTDSGSYIWDIRLVRLSGDSLIYRQADTLGSVSVQQTREIRLIRKSEMRLGEGAAGAMGALTGGDDEVFDLATLDYAARLHTIQQIFLMHPVH